MKNKILCILILLMIILSIFGAISFSAKKVKSPVKSTSGMDYSHTILAEYFTMTTCEPCKYAHQALKNIYKYHGKILGYHPFYYITMVFDDPAGNKWAKQRKEELGISATPNVAWDGGYRKDQGAESVSECESRYNTSIIRCGNRNVKDIDLELDVEWRGATNPDPSNNEIMVPVENNLSWTVTAMDIDVSTENNENREYNGHLHVYVTEVNSTYWDDKFGNPYTFAFLDYAWNENVTLTAGGSWSDTDEWDGMDHNSGYGEIFDEITEDNCIVIAALFDKVNSYYSDECDGFLAGTGTDPKQFDIYFGNTTPPPKVFSNTSIWEYDPDPDGNLEFDTTYYWKIDVWNFKGEPKYGDIWSFTTRGNDPPYTPNNPKPYNNSIGIPIDTNLSWYGGDPDLDDVTYDVYFGEYHPYQKPPQVAFNITTIKFDPSPLGNNLKFNTTYVWYIVAWDEYGYKTKGYTWFFTTEKNLPPYQASDPFPEDGETSVPVDLEYLLWNGSDPNSGDKLKYDVYFDDALPLLKRESNISEDFWEIPYTLSLYTTYLLAFRFLSQHVLHY